MEVTLLFPPATDVRSPHLAIPSLAAHLRGNGIRTNVRDLNLEGMLSLLDVAVLEEARQQCQRRFDASGDRDERSRLRQCLGQAGFVIANVARALATLRDPVAFYDPHRHHQARSCLLAALDLVSRAHGTVEYSVSSAVYKVDGIDISRLDHLAAVTADPAANLFDRLYQSVLPDLEHSDVVGISILNGQQIVPGLTLARLLKEHGHFVVIGGSVYAKFVEQLRARPMFFELFCHGLVPYEGETALVALVDALAGSGQLAGVPNFMHLGRSGQPVMGLTHVEDVDSLPTPDFGGLHLEQYLTPSPVLPILTGKGCYFNRCKFCDIPFINHISPKAYRVRAPELVAADVATLHANHGARHFEMTDETLSPRLLLRLADALRDRPTDRARFVGYARLEAGFTPTTCNRIYEMGVRKLFFGLESGSQETLDHMRKGIRLDHATAALANCADAGIGVHVFSIVGFPEEQEESARRTVAFLLDHEEVLGHPRNSFDIHPFGLDLRTEYGDEPERFGIEIDQAHLSRRDFPISVKEWTNTRGLRRDDVTRLMAEFDQQLRARYRARRCYPEAMWPGFEEYAVLYGDHYQDRPFDYRFSLPDDGDPLLFRLAWADDVTVDAADKMRPVVSGLGGTAAVGATAIRLLARPRTAMTIEGLMSSLAAAFEVGPADRPALVAELRAVIDRLLAIRALWLIPTGVASLEPAPVLASPG